MDIPTIWVTIKAFQLNDFENLDEFLVFIESHKSPEFIDYRLAGYAIFEELEGLRYMTDAEQTTANKKEIDVVEYATYLRLKEKYDRPN